MVFYPIGSTKACQVCANILMKKGFFIVDHPAPEITHLLLDVPGFNADGNLRGGNRLEDVLPMLPEKISVIGGKLTHAALWNYRCVDFLKDEMYLAQNAAITADCALKVIAPKMDFVFQGCSILILGWGRIGKCLAQMLRNLGCQVTVAVRKESDKAMLSALGYTAADYREIGRILPAFRIVFNTVPHSVLECPIPASCISVELASVDGIHGENIVIARGLPGRLAPESAGALMAETILRKIKEGTL